MIFNDFKKFKKELWKTFIVINKKRAAEQWLYMLKMNKLVIKYLIEFQCIAVLTDWNDNILVLQYYWRLSEDIKDKIA